MYLLDTNIWLEVLLAQARAGEVKAMHTRIGPGEAAMSDFTLYSIGILMSRHREEVAFDRFVKDTLGEGVVRLVRLPPLDLPRLVADGKTHGLDFDDAYQYAAARLHGLILVSFDEDFDKTPEGRVEPKHVAPPQE